MVLKLIKTEAEYKIALKRLDEIFDVPPGAPESNELDILAMEIDEYEKIHHPIEAPDPI